MPKIKPNRFKFLVRSRYALVALVFMALAGGATFVYADQYSAQIQSLQGQNAATQQLVNGLAAQASSYQDAISQLQTQISGMQNAIAINQAKQASLEQEIASDQQQITTKRGQLADIVKSMYIDGQTSTIEELATSKNLSDYVDKEEFRQKVQDDLNATIQEIASLENSLQQQKEQLDVVVSSEQQQATQLASAQAQQQSMLAYTQQQQASYTQKIQANQSQIAKLRAEQAAANAKLGGGLISSGVCGGGYPATAQGPAGNWGCDYPQDNTFDNWGMYNRECVSYTAFKVYQTYGYMPYWGGNGNAIDWPGNARRAGIATGSTPKAGSVAIWNVGAYGHAMWVEAVNPDGSILVSQYNYSYNGQYSEMEVSATMAHDLTYIYFGG